MIEGASLYALGRLLVSGPALESGMQHVVPAPKVMLRLMSFADLFLSNSSWVVVWAGWRMAGGEQCASASELGGVWEALSQCTRFGRVREFCAGAMLGV